MAVGTPASVLGDLRCYTRDEVRLWNWYCRVFPDRQDWESWCAELAAELLEIPSGTELRLVQRNRLEPDAKEHAFSRDDVLIGRGSDNDLVLPGSSTSKHHARVFRKGDDWFLEDRGSALGTRINGVKLKANAAAPLRNGDKFSIFPYIFTVGFRTLWVPGKEVALCPGALESIELSRFAGSTPAGHESFALEVVPTNTRACLQISRAFLEDLVNRSLRPLGGRPSALEVTGADRAVLEFIVLSVLETANRQLAFPFHFVLSPLPSARELGPSQSRGLGLTASVQISGTSGSLRVFLPNRLVEAMAQVERKPRPVADFDPLAWDFPLSAGFLELTEQEMRQIEPRDVLVYTPAAKLLFPRKHDRGWKGSLVADNPWAIRIDNYFDRRLFMELSEGAVEGEGTQQAPTPDFGQLPIILHVILGEKEMTLAEARSLARGSILELERGKSDAVDLAVNGRRLGKGELVEVEGKLGVRILSWRAS
jgi:type III secretion protein Q